MGLTSSNTRFGANFNNDTKFVDFRLFSKNGTAAILCIFDAPLGKNSIADIKMVKTGDVFETSLDPKTLNISLENPIYYGFRVFGPNYEYTENWAPSDKTGFRSKLDSSNNRFNPNKLAYDPYSKELSHLHSDVSDDLLPFRSNDAKYFEDNQKIAPKSVFKHISDTEFAAPSNRALKDEIIGEVHLKSLTALSDFKEKGTFKGAGLFAKKLKQTGVTMVEFLPLNEFDPKEGIGNYWGYMPLCYFALHKKYAFNQNDGDSVSEFRQMVNALHSEDIKVCMDIVYNHTGEARLYNNDPGDVNLFSYALIDNAEYYKSDANGCYALNSGCHNDANTAGAGFRNIIVDSLEYWINQGVDAFRFDLAAALMDTETGFQVNYDKNKSIISLMKTELEKRGITVNSPEYAGSGVNLIAEPWTCGGHNAYQLGNFPDFFAEWCDISRNTIRAFSIRPHSLDPLGLKNLILGTSQKFTNPFKAVNYVSCHDGFTLWDLNSYDKKSPSTSGGSDWELSSSYKGDKTLRDRAIRSQIALLALSSGCFMMQVDDMVLHSKGGNNNSYNLDTAVNYIDFNLQGEKKELCGFIKNLIDFRKNTPLLKSPEYPLNMVFYGADGNVIPPENTAWWLNTGNDFLSFSSKNGATALFCALNKGEREVEFKLPPCDDKKYYLIFDTKENDFSNDGILYENSLCKIAPHSIITMVLR